MSNAAQTLPEKNDSTAQSGSRSWGTFSAIGTAYGNIVANFSPSSAPTTYYTVTVPANVANYTLVALENKLTTLVSFSKPLGDAGVNITDIIIYN